MNHLTMIGIMLIHCSLFLVICATGALGDPIRWVRLQDFLFVESAAANSRYDDARQDGKSLLYFPVQSPKGFLSVQEVDLLGNNTTAEVVMERVTLKDGSNQLHVYGSELTDTGILLLCIYNLNVVVGVDLNSRALKFEIPNIPAPNDIAASPSNPSIFYIAGGAGIYSEEALVAAIPSIGVIYRVNVDDRSVSVVPTIPLNGLAGIACITDQQLMVSQLFNVISLPINTSYGSSEASTAMVDPSVKVIYDCVGSGYMEWCYLADNLVYSTDDRGQSTIAIALYRRTSNSIAAFLQSGSVAQTVLWALGKAASTVVGWAIGSGTALNDGSLHPLFHSMDDFPEVHFMLIDANSGDRRHIRLDSALLHPPDGSRFDGHVTHVHRHAGKVVLVNFLSQWVLVLDERELLAGDIEKQLFVQ